MLATLGAGWRIVHCADRVVELRKDDHAYRQYTGRDGYVRYRAEPGTERDAMIDAAIQRAVRMDAELANRMLQQMVPRRLGGYRMEQRTFAPVFGTPEDPEVIGIKRA